MKYFTLKECTYSKTARDSGICNIPTPEIEKNIVESVETLLDPLREAWETRCKQNGLGKVGINISSGYRCPELNKAVGGSSTAAHCHGYAFDLVPTNGQMRAFKRFCRDFLAGRAFDQLISEGEDDSGMPIWMHVGYKHPDGKRQRGQYLSMIHGKYYPMTD